ncbi:hypothetical protein [Streptomyces sp. enrichment culture]|uniref:hypothetical protein n=1 Tax=Streptomyces sp. enrichment culture TaxID=1795815 RepID=UPI003470F869
MPSKQSEVLRRERARKVEGELEFVDVGHDQKATSPGAGVIQTPRCGTLHFTAADATDTHGFDMRFGALNPVRRHPDITKPA